MWQLLAAACWMLLLGPLYGYHKKGSTTNPEANMNISQIISYWGYPYEKYDVVTKDGYVLGIYRIPHGRRSSGAAPRPVVYLQHGLIASATNWICNLPNNSLAFLLADRGYDVWMGNSRGNTWSRKHLKFSPTSPEFWAFSLDEMAKYDLPATINFIVEETGQERLYYVGHSQGTTIAFIAFSTNPELAKRIKIFFALAPVTTVQYTQSPMRKLTTLSREAVKDSQSSKDTFKLLVILLEIPQVEMDLLEVLFGDKMFSPHTFFEQFIATKVCNRKLFHRICSNFLFSFSGFDPKNLNMNVLWDIMQDEEENQWGVYPMTFCPLGPVQDATRKKRYIIFYLRSMDALCGLYEDTARDRRMELREGKLLKDGLLWLICLQRSRLDVYLAQSPAGTSVQNMLHWSQAVNSGLFQAFDWGNPYQNMQHFHQLTPPLYNVSEMDVPTAVWSGGQDRVANSKDTENLLPKITRLIYYKFIPHYNHVDFYLGQDAPQEIYQDLIRMMEECF